jgi:hypothetical protein
MILLLDEVHTIKPEDSKEIIKYYQDGMLQSVVFVSHSYEETQLSDEVKSYLKGNVIKTVPLNQDEVYELVRSRIGDIELFSKKSLKTIFDLADKNPRKFLEYCEDVARYAVERDEYKINDEHIEAVLDIKPERTEKPKAEKIRAEEKPLEVKAEKIKIEKPIEVKARFEKPLEAKPKLEKPIEVKPKLEKAAVEKAVKLTEEKVKKPILEKPVLEKPIMVKTESPKIEVKPLEEVEAAGKDEDEEPKRQKKYKINKLVENSKEALGEIQANDEPEKDSDIPEYKVFAFDN